MYRVLVTGGREYGALPNGKNKPRQVAHEEQRHVFRTLSDIHANREIDLLINGDADGADSVAQMWARENEVPYLNHPARWKKDGKKAAGPIRNSAMLAMWHPSLCVSFPGNTGTADMVKKCLARGVEVRDERRAPSP